MNKTTQIKSEESQINVNKNQRKSKFNKFFSTVTAVMIASSIALGPMTLRGEETENKEIKTVQDANEKLVDGMEKVVKKAEKKLEEVREEIKEKEAKLKEIDKKIEQNNKEIEESKKREMEAKKQEIEAAKKIEETNKELLEICEKMKNKIEKGKEYCNKNSCTEQQLEQLSFGINTYKKVCKELIVKK